MLIDRFFHVPVLLFCVAAIGAIPTFWEAISGLKRSRITIDAFNTFAMLVAFATGDARTAAFIVLMLTFANLLEWRTAARMKDAVAELLKLKPIKAERERDGHIEDIAVDHIRLGDILVIKDGARIPVDGKVIFGKAQIDESSVTGESMPVKKLVGDRLLAGTLNESGLVKMRATHVGEDSTIERMATLMREAATRKSRSERLADRFAAYFLPAVALLGLGVLWFTRDPMKMASIFLVACADDMAVALPLAMTAALGFAAKRGVIIKGGQSLDVLHRIRTLVLDKTGTLTYGKLSIRHTEHAQAVTEKDLWMALAIAEKYSDHPVGRAVFYEAEQHLENIPDPDEYGVIEGGGVWARVGSDEYVVGNEHALEARGIRLAEEIREKLRVECEEKKRTTFLVFVNHDYTGMVTVADTPRPEAAESLRALRHLGVKTIIMFTGDNEIVAKESADHLELNAFTANMKPEDKLRSLERMMKEKTGAIAMVGDGVNDAPTLARADIGIAMGKTGTAVAVEAADIVITTDNLLRLPEMVRLSRRTLSIVKSDIWIWAISNLAGFALVLTGLIGPALAAFYNFATDFLPLLNSTRLFRSSAWKTSPPTSGSAHGKRQNML